FSVTYLNNDIRSYNEYGVIECLEYLRKIGVPFHESILEDVVKNGSCLILEYVCRNIEDSINSDIYNITDECGSKKCIEFMHVSEMYENDECSWNQQLYIIALDKVEKANNSIILGHEKYYEEFRKELEIHENSEFLYKQLLYKDALYKSDEPNRLDDTNDDDDIFRERKEYIDIIEYAIDNGCEIEDEYIRNRVDEFIEIQKYIKQRKEVTLLNFIYDQHLYFDDETVLDNDVK